jgi:hypothetical protein
MTLYTVEEYLGVLLVVAVSTAIILVLAVAFVLSQEVCAWRCFRGKTKVDPPSAPRTEKSQWST